MVRHWDRFEEDEIVCLAQVFANMELMGCKYPRETMIQVTELAKEVPEIQRYRASRSNKLKRTFVGAQDAVQAKYRKVAATTFNQSGQQLEDWSEKEKTEIKELWSGSPNIPSKPSIQFTVSQKADNLRSLLKDVIFFEVLDDNSSLNKTISCIQKTGKLEMKHDGEAKKYFYIFNDQIIGEGKGESRKTAKKAADEDLVKTLKANCFTIRSKLDYYTAEAPVGKLHDQNASGESNLLNPGRLQENNLGFKMLKMLGWTGGSLGAKGEGIVDPISLEIKIDRSGLGANSNGLFNKKYIQTLMRNFKNNQMEYDLVFTNEFTKEERAQIHL